VVLGTGKMLSDFHPPSTYLHDSQILFGAVVHEVRQKVLRISEHLLHQLCAGIGSRGIRIPKTLLEEAELPEHVELRAEPGRLVVEAVRHARKGWTAAAQRMRARAEDQLLDEPIATRFDREEWDWR
jgi:antitoxin MazE